MTIEIVEKGELPGDKMYERRCGGCNSLLRFKRSDAELRSEDGRPSWLEIDCPVCHHAVTAKP